jgi:hypothetical protein
MSTASKRALHDLTATEAADLILRREISSLDLVEALLARIERLEPALRSFVTVDAQGARAAAKAADAALQVGQATGALRGVPFAAKDIYDAEGLPTTAGYPPLAKNVAKADAFTVARMKAAGAVLIGKTVTTQFASGDPSPTRNPWRADRTPGGSSSGSGAAVAARLVPIALGTQTGGSTMRARSCAASRTRPSCSESSPVRIRSIPARSRRIRSIPALRGRPFRGRALGFSPTSSTGRRPTCARIFLMWLPVFATPGPRSPSFGCLLRSICTWRRTA